MVLWPRVKYLLPAITVISAGLLFTLLYRSMQVPGFDSVRVEARKSDVLLLDRNGRLLHEHRVDFQERRLQWYGLEEISPSLLDAVVKAEDQRFWEHPGIDLRALVAGAVQWLRSGSSRGASTISMQVAGLLRSDLRPNRNGRSLWQKVKQILTALNLEHHWSKEGILEAYLNLVSFRGELTGIGASSRGFFGKVPHGLSISESLVLASLIRAPNASAEHLRWRAQELSSRFYGDGSEEEIRVATEAATRSQYRIGGVVQLAPHASRKLLRERGDLGNVTYIRTTIDVELQAFCLGTVQHRLKQLKGQNVRDAAVVVVDNARGEVLAYVGNGGEESSARYVDGVLAPRQAGSTLKPFLYALAFENRVLTPASIIDDAPLELMAGGGIYRPSNYDKTFRGPVSCREALASSLNVPAVRVLNLIGVDQFVIKLKQAGFAEIRSGDFYGPSLALGAAEIKLWELVNGFRTLANKGEWSTLRLVPEETGIKRREVFSEGAAFLVGDILSDRQSRHATFNLESPLSTRFWTAVKTGTSKDMRDNWCVGFSEAFTVGVWVGNFSGEPMWNVSGITGAAPIWVEIMNRLHRRKTSRPPEVPENITLKEVFDTSTGMAGAEYFIAGTEASISRQARTAVVEPRITYPVSGSIIAVDPDIPHGFQRAFFEAQPFAPGFRFRLNGDELGSAEGPFGWRPVSGRHELSLVDNTGKIVDEVLFFVRGR